MNDKGIKIVFVDIDGTLLNHENGDNYDCESIEALKKTQSSGVMVYIATARPFDSVVHIGLFDLFTPDGLICNNGAIAMDKNKKLIRHDYYPIKTAKEIIKVANKHHVVIEVATAFDRFFTAKFNQYVDGYFSIFQENLAPIKKYDNELATALLLFCPPSYDERLLKELPYNLIYRRFSPFGVDVLPHDVNKGQGINDVLNYYHFKKEEAMGIGDEKGDISMFENVLYSVAMGNAKEEIKARAKYVTDNINKHGVKNILEVFNLYEK